MLYNTSLEQIFLESMTLLLYIQSQESSIGVMTFMNRRRDFYCKLVADGALLTKCLCK